MQELKPKKISRPDSTKLSILWNDGLESTLVLSVLRDNCPCAQCTTGDKGKSKLNKLVENSLREFKYNLKELKPVGNYAVKPVWGDGHEIGIYRWEHLRQLCENNSINEI